MISCGLDLVFFRWKHLKWYILILLWGCGGLILKTWNFWDDIVLDCSSFVGAIICLLSKLECLIRGISFQFPLKTFVLFSFVKGRKFAEFLNVSKTADSLQTKERSLNAHCEHCQPKGSEKFLRFNSIQVMPPIYISIVVHIYLLSAFFSLQVMYILTIAQRIYNCKQTTSENSYETTHKARQIGELCRTSK